MGRSNSASLILQANPRLEDKKREHRFLRPLRLSIRCFELSICRYMVVVIAVTAKNINQVLTKA